METYLSSLKKKSTLDQSFLFFKISFYKFFGYKFYLDAYTFPKYENCKKQIELDFLFKKNLFIEERNINISNEININDTIKIDLIKIDINGNEIDIVRSLLNIIQKDTPVIYLENNFDMDEIIKILSKFNYIPYIFNLSDNKFYQYKNEEVLNIFFIKDLNQSN